MDVHKIWTDDRAVSPVVGVALLIAITVILAAVIGGVVLGLGTSSAEAPQASLQFEFSDNDTLAISHEGGEALASDTVEVRLQSDNGELTDEFDEDLSAGEQITINMDPAVEDGDEVAVVWMDPNSGDEAVIGTTEYRA